MQIQTIVEKFEKALWEDQNPDILDYVELAPKNNRPALLLILEELKEFHSDAIHAEIPGPVLNRIYDSFQREIASSTVREDWTLKRFFGLALSLGKSIEELENVFGIPVKKLKKLTSDSTPLGKRKDFGKEARLTLSKKYSIELSQINKIVNRAFSAINILENAPLKAFTRSREGDIDHFQESEIKQKLIEAIFKEDSDL